MNSVVPSVAVRWSALPCAVVPGATGSIPETGIPPRGPVASARRHIHSLAASAVLLLAIRPAVAEENGPLWNGQDVDVTVMMEYISKFLGKRFVYSPEQLRGKKIAIVADQRIPRDKVYKIFQTIMHMNGFVLVEYDEYVRVEESPKAKLLQTGVLSPQEAAALSDEDRLITRVFTLRHLTAATAGTMAQRLLDPQAEQAVPVPERNALVVTGFARNLARVEQVLAVSDLPGPGAVSELVPLKQARAEDVEKSLQPVLQQMATRRARAAGPITPVPPGTAPQPLSPPVQVILMARNNAILLVGAEDDVRQLRELVTQLDVPGLEVKTEVLALKHVAAADLSKQLQGLVKNHLDQRAKAGPKQGLANPQAAADERTNAVILTGTEDELQGFRDIIARLDVEVAKLETEVKVFPVRNASAEDVQKVLERVLRTGAPEPAAAKTAGPEATKAAESRFEIAVQGGALIVRAPREMLARIEQLIKELDVRKPKVLIEAAIVELAVDKDFNLGFELATINEPGSSMKPFAGTNVGLSEYKDTNNDGVIDMRLPTLTEGVIAGAFKNEIGKIPVLLKALDKRSRVRVLAAPMVVADDSQEASFRASDQYPVATFTTTQSTTDVTSFGGFQEAGIELKIRPNINVEEGYLRLDIRQKVEVFKGNPAAANLPPRKDHREIAAIVTVPDGRMVVIGGLSNNRVERERTGVPYLHKVPLLGVFFRGTENKDVETRLYAFVSPRILKDFSFEDYERLSKEHHDKIDEFMKEEQMQKGGKKGGQKKPAPDSGANK